MATGWQYRLSSVFGVAALVALSLIVAYLPPVASLFGLLPVVGDLPIEPPTEAEFFIEAGTTVAVMVGVVAPLYKPRQRRILDIWMLAIRRTFVALLALATIGYFDYTYRLPRSTLLIVGTILLVAIPAWFVVIRRRPQPSGGRTIIIGDDPGMMNDIYETVEGDVIGYASPPATHVERGLKRSTTAEYTDGGTMSPLVDLPCLGGLSRLDEVLVDNNADTAVLAFAHPDRAEFFGALDSCYKQGVAAKIHRDHAHLVLTPEVGSGELVDIDLEPWDPQDHVIKRLFDVTFASSALLVLLPVIVAITVAIKLDDDGPLLYSQERTTTFGETFTVYKFRSMITDAESESGVTLSSEDVGGVDPRVTRVGRFLRKTHLDEIPQLWSILLGKMSVVGPRPERPALDEDMEQSVDQWRSRWFVKPGLTGLAQVNNATGYNPEEKLRYDIEYIRRQSFWFDLKIVVRQLWKLLSDATDALLDNLDENEE